MKRTIKKIGLIVIMAAFVFFSTSPIQAQDIDGFNILPELTEDEIETINTKINEIGQTGGNVWDKYNETASAWNDDPSKQLQSGVMTRQTIINYITFVIKFLSQLGIAAGAIFIMIAGYKYMVSVFQGGKVPSDSIKNAIIGVIIVIFSYAIMKTLTSIVGLS